MTGTCELCGRPGSEHYELLPDGRMVGCIHTVTVERTPRATSATVDVSCRCGWWATCETYSEALHAADAHDGKA